MPKHTKHHKGGKKLKVMGAHLGGKTHRTKKAHKKAARKRR